jgi:quercetin dioxygenase-like cupin family protein
MLMHPGNPAPRSLILFTLLLASCASNNNTAQQSGYAPITHERYGSEMQPFATHPVAQIVWKPGPPSLPPGAQMAVLDGDPTQEGPFVFRVKVPDGYTIPPHTHPKAERVTVIQGTFNIAEGQTVDKSPGKGRVMSAGSFGYWPARMHHYAWVTGETIAQFHGIGPWTIQYLNPQDDPRNAKK